MVNAPVVRMGPLPRSLAAEANDCFMVGVPADPTEYKYAAQGIAPNGRLPSVRITVVYSARPYIAARHQSRDRSTRRKGTMMLTVRKVRHSPCS